MGNFLIANGYFHRQGSDSVRSVYDEVFGSAVSKVGEG